MRYAKPLAYIKKNEILTKKVIKKIRSTELHSMIQTKYIQKFLVIATFLIGFQGYCQYGVIEMKNGEQFEMASPDLIVEGDELRYFKEEWKRKTSVMGFGAKKLRKEYLAKSRTVKFNDIKKIHARGELFLGNQPFIDFEGIRYIKLKRYYEKFYVITEGACSLLIKAEDGNAWYSYYVQTGNEEPYQIHKAGTGLGAKFRKRSRKYFAECEPAMEYIQNDLKKSTLPELIEVYNANCAK